MLYDSFLTRVVFIYLGYVQGESRIPAVHRPQNYYHNTDRTCPRCLVTDLFLWRIVCTSCWRPIIPELSLPELNTKDEEKYVPAAEYIIKLSLQAHETESLSCNRPESTRIYQNRQCPRNHRTSLLQASTEEQKQLLQHAQQGCDSTVLLSWNPALLTTQNAERKMQKRSRTPSMIM